MDYSHLYAPSARVLGSFAAAPSMPKAEVRAFSPSEPQPQSLRNFFSAGRSITVPAASEGPIAMYSPQFYAACTVGGAQRLLRGSVCMHYSFDARDSSVRVFAGSLEVAICAALG